MSELPVPPRAIAVGIPERLKADILANLPNVLVVDDNVEALALAEDSPHMAVLYGELAFGPAVTGQPLRLLNDQVDHRAVSRVVVVMDHHPDKLTELEWDDPRLLAIEAAVALSAGRLVAVCEPGAWLALDVVLDEIFTWTVDMPPVEGVPSRADGND